MVCEFLPPKYKAKLVDLAKPVELAEAGYTLQSAYKIKQKKVISDEKCEELVKILGERAAPVIQEALNEFISQINKLGITAAASSSLMDCSKINEIYNKLDEILQLLKSKKKTPRDLDILYDKMKDSLGYVRIDNLRKELGMSLEEFLSTFSDHIEKHYELIPGGDEGFIRNGILYGIIRRKH